MANLAGSEEIQSAHLTVSYRALIGVVVLRDEYMSSLSLILQRQLDRLCHHHVADAYSSSKASTSRTLSVISELSKCLISKSCVKYCLATAGYSREKISPNLLLSQFFFIHGIFTRHIHACPLIEPRCACEVSRINAESDSGFAAFVKLAKDVT